MAYFIGFIGATNILICFGRVNQFLIPNVATVRQNVVVTFHPEVFAHIRNGAADLSKVGGGPEN